VDVGIARAPAVYKNIKLPNDSIKVSREILVTTCIK